jgi:hypothetical protein
MERKIENNQIDIRDVAPEDLPFIFNSWLKSYRNGGIPKFVDNTIYFSEHHKLIERLLQRATTKVACSPTDPTNIYGYICYERIDGVYVLHYAYVKHTFRNLGILRAMIKASGHDGETAGALTHGSGVTDRIGAKFKLTYHPYILINYRGDSK